MLSISRQVRRIRSARLLTSESGVALPTVIIAVIAASGLAAAALTASVGSQRGTVRDQNSKEALAVAEAGVSEALLHYNRLRTTSPNLCVSGTTTLVASAPGAGGWCAPQTRTMAATTNTYTYSVRPIAGQIEVVSTGNVDGVTRRVEVLARSSGGERPFGDASVIGLNSINIDPSSVVTADVATNGNIGLQSASQLRCGLAHVGHGRGFAPANGSSTCTPTQTSTSLPPVNPGNVWTTNNNNRICVQDVITGGGSNTPVSCPAGSTVPWNPTTRSLQFSSNTSITLGAPGGIYNYSFCSVTLSSQTAIYIAASSTVRIYFGSPEECNQSSGVTQLQMNSNSVIEATGSNASQLAMFFVGSDTLQTRINLNSNAIENQACTNDFVIYAPRTDVNFNANAHYCGALAAKSIFINSQASITASNSASDFELPGTVAHHFVTEEFVECSATNTSTTPDAGC